MKTKPFWLSTSILSGTALLTLCLTTISLYFKAIGHNIGEVIPLLILSFSTYAINIRGRIKADSKLTFK